MSNLAIFDIDGTLLHSTRLDDCCFAQSIRDVFGLSGFSTNWLEYRHSTDSGILAELLETHFGRQAREEELRRFQDHFQRMLEEAAAGRPDAVQEVPGAARLIECLRQDSRWQVAIATGTWRSSALWKLELAGIDPTGLNLATSNDAHDRADIVRTVIRSAAQENGREPPRAVYLGDGLWDLRAASQLGIGFVGIAVDGCRQRLLDAGAEHVLTDYRDPDRVIQLLDSLARDVGGV